MKVTDTFGGGAGLNFSFLVQPITDMINAIENKFLPNYRDKFFLLLSVYTNIQNN